MEGLYLNIKSRRRELKMTQDELAAKVGYADKTMISRIEHGKIDLSQSMVNRFAKALETTPQDLMGWVEPDLSSSINTDLTLSALTAYGPRDFWAYRILEVGDHIPNEGKKELVSFAEFLASKYGFTDLTSEEDVHNMFFR